MNLRSWAPAVVIACALVVPATAAAQDVCNNSLSPHQNYRTQSTLLVQANGTSRPTIWVGVEHKGIYRSINGGLSWEKRDNGLRGYPRADNPAEICIRELGRIVADPNDPTHLYALRVETPGRLDMMHSETGGIYETRNAGSTWTQLTGYGNASGGHALAVVGGGATPTVFMGSGNSQASWAGAPPGFYNTVGVLYRSTNGGASWTELDQRAGTPTIDPYMAISQVFTDATGTRVWAPVFVRSATGAAGVDAVQMGFVESADGGATWTRGTASLPDSTARAGINGHVAPTNFNHRLLVATNSPPSEGAPPGPAASWYTTNGTTWNKTSRYVYVARYTPHDAAGLTLFGYDPFAGSPSEPTQGVLKSVDGGATWNRIGALPPGVDNQSNGIRISNFAFHPTDANVIYASGSGARVWRSSDGGVTWATLLSLDSTEMGGPGLPQTEAPGTPPAPRGTYGYGRSLLLYWEPPTTGGRPASYLVQSATNAAFTTGVVEETASDADDTPSHNLHFGATTWAPVRYVRLVAVNNIGRSAAGPVQVFHALTPRFVHMKATKDGAAGALVATSLPVAVQVPWTGTGAPAWTATSSQPWFQISGGSGTGAGQFTLTIANPNNVIAGNTSLMGAITVTMPSLGVSSELLVFLTVSAVGTSVPAFGQVDTPLQNAGGVQGAIGVTGWALDDLGVTGVKIYRNCLPAENQANCQIVLGANVVEIGDAAFLTGARPDVEAAFETMPNNHRAGWGYLMLTSMLPHVPTGQPYGGQGTLTIYAVATDVEGNKRLLGRSSDPASADYATPTAITMTNDAIAKPFGALDTPGQGATVSGVLHNFGWALTLDGNSVGDEPGDILVPLNGSTMTVFIDSLPVAQVTANQCRGNVGNPVPAGVFCNDDVANIFGNPTPQAALLPRSTNPTRFRNLDAARGAIGSYSIDTTTLSNGLHTIAWSVTDSAGRTEGIGSRFFVVLNGGGADSTTRHGGQREDP